MGMCRGKQEAPIEVVQHSRTYGELPFELCKCGCNRWFDTKTFKEVQVGVTTLDDLINQENECKVKL